MWTLGLKGLRENAKNLILLILKNRCDCESAFRGVLFDSEVRTNLYSIINSTTGKYCLVASS